MQFIFAPIWGRLSDRIGRRPVLLASTAFASLSYALFALGTGLPGRTALLVFMLSRMLAGVCGANLTVAQAYVADISTEAFPLRRQGFPWIDIRRIPLLFGPTPQPLRKKSVLSSPRPDLCKPY